MSSDAWLLVLCMIQLGWHACNGIHEGVSVPRGARVHHPGQHIGQVGANADDPIDQHHQMDSNDQADTLCCLALVHRHADIHRCRIWSSRSCTQFASSIQKYLMPGFPLVYQQLFAQVRHPTITVLVQLIC